MSMHINDSWNNSHKYVFILEKYNNTNTQFFNFCLNEEIWIEQVQNYHGK